MENRRQTTWDNWAPVTKIMAALLDRGFFLITISTSRSSALRKCISRSTNSFSFRYSHSKKGKPSLPRDLKNISLRHFGDLMGRLADYLYGMDEAVSWLAETKAEMQAG